MPLLALALMACGTAADEPPDSPHSPPHVQIYFEDTSGYSYASAVTAPAPPVTLVLTLAGPDGALHETVAYAKGEVRFPDLRAGKWTLRGDGLDKAGQVTWTATPVAFTVHDGRAAEIELVFQPLE